MRKFGAIAAVLLSSSAAAGSDVLVSDVERLQFMHQKVETTKVASGRGYVVHAVPTYGGLMLVHTTLPEGRPSILVDLSGSGQPVVDYLSTIRPTSITIKVNGLAVRDHRIAVVADAVKEQFAGRNECPIDPLLPLESSSQSISLMLFDAKNGKFLNAITLFDMKPSKQILPVSIKPGPLKWEGNHIKLFGRVVRIKDDKLFLVPEARRPGKRGLP